MKYIILALIFFVGCNTPPPIASSSSPVESAPPIVSRVTPDTPAVQQTTSTVAGVQIVSLDPYTCDNRTCCDFVVPSSISRATFLVVIKQLHRDNPTAILEFFDADDADMLNEYKVSAIHEPDESYPFPEAWANTHLLGIANKMIAPGGGKWMFSPSFGGIRLCKGGPDSDFYLDN